MAKNLKTQLFRELTAKGTELKAQLTKKRSFTRYVFAVSHDYKGERTHYAYVSWEGERTELDHVLTKMQLDILIEPRVDMLATNWCTPFSMHPRANVDHIFSRLLNPVQEAA